MGKKKVSLRRSPNAGTIHPPRLPHPSPPNAIRLERQAGHLPWVGRSRSYSVLYGVRERREGEKPASRRSIVLYVHPWWLATRPSSPPPCIGSWSLSIGSDRPSAIPSSVGPIEIGLQCAHIHFASSVGGSRAGTFAVVTRCPKRNDAKRNETKRMTNRRSRTRGRKPKSQLRS